MWISNYERSLSSSVSHKKQQQPRILGPVSGFTMDKYIDMKKKEVKNNSVNRIKLLMYATGLYLVKKKKRRKEE